MSQFAAKSNRSQIEGLSSFINLLKKPSVGKNAGTHIAVIENQTQIKGLSSFFKLLKKPSQRVTVDDFTCQLFSSIGCGDGNKEVKIIDLGDEIFGNFFIDWYESAEYRKKYNRTIRLLNIWKNQEADWSLREVVYPPAEIHSTFFSAIDKKSLLQKVSTLADELSQSFDKHKEALYLYFKNCLYAHLTEEEIKILDGSVENVQSTSLLHVFKKFLHSILLHLRRLSQQGIRRDLRQFLRNIVHFLFKNMSDEADSNNFLFNLGQNKKLLATSKLICNEHKTNYRSLRKYYQC